MNRKRLLSGRAAPVYFLGVILALVFASLFFALRARERPLNILLIVADTLRADHLGCYGFEAPTSPHLDGLAEKGTRFTRCYTVVPSTLASFTSILTSMHPKDHGAYRNGIAADGSLPLLCEVFQRGGYETTAFISSYCLSARFGMSRGFEYFDEAYSRETPLLDNREIRSARDVTDAFLRWIQRRPGDRPFFAMVHYFDPHWPYDPPEHLLDRFGASKIPPPSDMPSFVAAQALLKASGGRPGPFEENLHNLYCAEVRYMDNQIGRILEYIERFGLEENTLIVFLSDHGETFWEHDDYWNHGLFVYDTTIHVPLMICCPRLIPSSKLCETLVSTLDIGPTLCNLAGLEIPPSFQGSSFASPLLTGEARVSGDGPVFSEGTMPWHVEENAPRPNFNKAKCVRSGPWKFIDFPFMEDGRQELYNLSEDPMERRNRIGDPEAAGIEESLRDTLDRWARHYRSFDRKIEPMDEETLKKLEGLGYTGGK